MLRSLTLSNFRGFVDHRVDFEKETILIGRNNAGKTTVVEALRVLSVCQARVQSTSFIPRPSWLEGHCEGAGFRLSFETIDFDFNNVQHGYDKTTPAYIKAKLSNNNEIHIYIGKDSSETFCQVRKGQRHVVHDRSEISTKTFGITKVMPPVGSLLPHEKIIAKQRVNRYLDGYLAYRHLRNQLWERPAEYRKFKDLLAETWPGLIIQHFENDHGDERNEYSLLIREGRFTSEISWHGHGLQAWIQTIWFLSRVDKASTIVLDEPDVYLHADLQRKLIKVIEGFDFNQSIIATHSPEIISDVPFQNVIVVQKREKISRPASKASEIQQSLRQMGSIHSIQLSKLADKGLVLFVEGDDKSYLTDVAFKMGAQMFDRFSDIAIQETKGKGNWQQALGAADALRKISNGDIQAALLLDGDYMLAEERAAFYEKAAAASLDLTIWERKEIENYFINPTVIARLISQNASDDLEVDRLDIASLIEETEKELQQDLTLSYSDVMQKFYGKRYEPKTCFKMAKDHIDAKISSGQNLSDMIDGKEIISSLSRKSKSLYGVSFNALSVCKETRLSEFPNELTNFIGKICAKKFR
ncbi:AAA family ATPase [Sphingomonas sp. CGMCC 1.13654]|uniref:AAA family ATPase n=1 Tax=Sphingomonas chungangi TaxID=2683589 RepID=A0A838L0R1_9SPHN|nr:ATP-binding protein [Sphingomonas chungangi]MBA2933083.1 AAA family ATPase [Sphingomonas chungangi]MVW56703.1 AAA family ATPase [Sphingomonas chungangi]